MNWSAAALLVIGLTCAVSAIMTVAASAPAATLLALAAGGALTALRAVERRSPHPLLPIPPGARRPLAAACLVAGVMNLCALGSLFLLTLVLQDVQGRDPLAAGLLVLPAMLPLPLLGAPAGRLATRIGVWRISVLGLIVAAVGLVGMAMTIDGAGPFTLAIALVVWGIGLGVLTPAIVAAALRAVPDLPGLAAGASNTSRQTGGALGIALFAALAGPSGAASFPSNAANLFVGSAVAFVVAAVACLTMVRVHS
ncbi:MFS transporter [Gordonia phthalatica]|uniref:MFS transporter n=1 Tax=Gordonia phthalatica TaxID=1136941 RepID=UPI0007862CFF|nr:MFS transporter [Gordonia phthalatica]